MKNDTKSILDHELVYPLPVTLLPSKFPKKQFDFAKEIQPYVGELVHNIANDHDFLKESLADVIKADEFTRNLWEIYETVRSEGIAQVRETISNDSTLYMTLVKIARMTG